MYGQSEGKAKAWGQKEIQSTDLEAALASACGRPDEKFGVG